MGPDDGSLWTYLPIPRPTSLAGLWMHLAASVDDPAAAEPADASDLAWITPTLQAEFDTFDCAVLDDPERGEQPTDEPLDLGRAEGDRRRGDR